ncbi:2-oxo acid dehydrogenase subunit E2 [Niveispirillum fermenti]|uniref:2-oxo acid dehydrogenase subunit E2 n=1 Tax=Niveispirillum fermenti TaxID=1233113 RepID=UPI003A8A3AAB
MAKLRAFTMPKWGIEMTEGTIGEWMLKEGDAFKKGQLITLIETDKITNEVEAEFDATLARVLAQVGQTLPVGALLGVFSDGTASPAELDAFIAAFKPADVSTAAGDAAGPSPAAPPAPPPPIASAPSPIPDHVRISPAARELALGRGVDVGAIAGSGRDGRVTHQDVDQASRPPVSVGGGAPVSVMPTTTGLDTVFASPLAKRLAVQHGVNLSGLTGTGPRGRICKQDVLGRVERVASQPATLPPAPAPRSEPVASPPAPATADPGVVEIVRMSPMRKAIARQLSLSKQTIPHFYLRMSVRVDALQAMRAAAKAATGEAPSVNDYVVRAVALALQRHPAMNIQVHGDEIHRFGQADIAIAVATEKGLVTPIVRAADTKSVARIAADVKALAERARANRLQADEFQGGSFSISNLGMYGIDQFDAIINPPQGAILAVGAARRQPIDMNHALGFATLMQLSLSSDHRAIDGALAAQFMATLRGLLEEPAALTA